MVIFMNSQFVITVLYDQADIKLLCIFLYYRFTFMIIVAYVVWRKSQIHDVAFLFFVFTTIKKVSALPF